jgi:excisionase family DNA binding protein
MEESRMADGLVNYEGARVLLGGVSWMTVHRLVKCGELERVRIGSRVLFRRSDIERLIRRRNVSTQGRRSRREAGRVA